MYRCVSALLIEPVMLTQILYENTTYVASRLG